MQNKFNKLSGIDWELPINNIDEIEKALWLINTNKTQGTAFMTEFGLITCSHVLDKNYRKITNFCEPNKEYSYTVVAENET